jgi:hypothetical protein
MKPVCVQLLDFRNRDFLKFYLKNCAVSENNLKNHKPVNYEYLLNIIDQEVNILNKTGDKYMVHHFPVMYSI